MPKQDGTLIRGTFLQKSGNELAGLLTPASVFGTTWPDLVGI
jgi:hypothetical protein